MEIPFKGQYDRSTFFRAVRLANRPGKRSGRTRWLVTAALGVVVVIAGQMYLQDPVGDPFNLVRLGLALGLLAVFLAWPYALSYLQARKLWNEPALRQMISGRIGEKGITYTNTSPHRTVPWDKFARLRVAADMVALLTPTGVLTAFPRSFFRNDSDWRAFRELIQRKVFDMTNRPVNVLPGKPR